MVQLTTIHARDIMQTDVVTFLPSTTIESAIETFEDLHISGAPVVDASGHVIGMLSAFDVAKADHVRAGRIDTVRGSYAMTEPSGEEADGEATEDVFLSMEDFSPATTGRGTVSEWMSSEVVSVRPESTLPAICRLMVDEHIHRVPVVQQGRLKGIVSSLDVVRCVAGLHEKR